MAIVDTFIKGTQPYEIQQGEVGYFSRVIDFSNTTDEEEMLYRALPIKAGLTVLKAGVRIIKKSDTSVQAHLGDDDYSLGFFHYEDISSNNNTIFTVAEVNGYIAGRYYVNDNNIVFQPRSDVSDAVIEIWALVCKSKG